MYFQSFPAGPSGYAYAVVSYPGGGFCPGAKLRFWIPQPDPNVGTWVGYEDYIQINPSIANGSYFYTATGGWTVVLLGPIATVQPCSGWTGPHVHQSGGTGPNIFTNWGLDDDNGGGYGLGINPTWDTTYNYLHTINY